MSRYEYIFIFIIAIFAVIFSFIAVSQSKQSRPKQEPIGTVMAIEICKVKETNDSN